MNRVEQIHEQALAVAKRYKQAEVELIDVLQLVGEHRVFYHLKFNSLFQYAMQALQLSEEVACIYINVARKASEVPALKKEIQAGNISVSKAKTICSVLNSENQNHWLEVAKNSSKRQIERQVAIASPNHAVREQAKYSSEAAEERAKILNLREVFVELKLGVPEKVMMKIRQAQDLVSQSKQQHVNLAQTLEALADLYIEKRDPVEKAKRQKMRGKLSLGSDEVTRVVRDANVKSSVPGPVNVDAASPVNSAPSIKPASPFESAPLAVREILNESSRSHKKREPFTAAIRHQLYLKHHGQCAHVDAQGVRCNQKRMLEIHHLMEVSEGGSNELENLTLWCRGHHQAHHLVG